MKDSLVACIIVLATRNRIANRVCSILFPNGCKTYLNNVPSIAPKTKGRRESKRKTTIRARNRLFAKDKENVGSAHKMHVNRVRKD